MKTLLRNISLLVFLTVYPLYNFANEISAHDYAAKVHDDIIQIIQTKNALYIEDPDKFTKEISDAFSPIVDFNRIARNVMGCLLYTSPSPRDRTRSRMPSSA